MAIEIVDRASAAADGIRDLAWTAAFGDDPATVEAAQWIVWEASQALGVRSASIHDLYMARARGEVSGFTVPAINIRAQTFDMARITFETATQFDVGAVILELARSEQTYTFQRPIDYATSVLAGAIAAGWRGPVFLQGDHYQFNAKKYAADPEAMTEEIRRACRLAVDAGYRNIDIDSSTLVDLSLPTVDEQQRANYERAAELTALIRTLEADGVTISVGGEIGEVGKENSNEAELRAYLDGLPARARSTGAGRDRHLQGERPDRARPMAAPCCRTARSDRPPSTSRSTRSSASSPVASTGSPAPCSTGRRRCPTSCSITSATSRPPRSISPPGFQNALYEHPAFPQELHREIEAWCFANALDERKPDQTDQQFVYTTRKKALGPFKRQLWELPTRDAILADQAKKIGFLFRELGVDGSRSMVDRYVQPVESHRTMPESLSEAAPAR